jgi:glycine/D-amino acid oxidase-like deaminating enzyme
MPIRFTTVYARTFSPAAEKTQGKKLQGLPPGSSIAVIGAGAFGGWLALYLLRHSYTVTLVDTWGPGNARSSSGDETRVIRSSYGANELYFDLNVRALELWQEHQEHWKRKLFERKGVLWLCYDDHTPVIDDSIPFAEKHRMSYEKLTPEDVDSRYGIVNTRDLRHAYLDPHGGFLFAREACQAVQQAFVAAGGTYIQAQASPGTLHNGRMNECLLSNGQKLKADAFVFACGSWLGQLFPDVLSATITCTKQEVYYIGMPAKNARQYEDFPVWIDADGTNFYYGIPGNAHRGFKIGVDLRGESFDPSQGNRVINPEVLTRARAFISHRFPGLANEPLVENRVCPYENSPDGNFLFDHHPEATNLFFLGGGSGHGFKHGPALGERIAECICGTATIPGDFLLR